MHFTFEHLPPSKCEIECRTSLCWVVPPCFRVCMQLLLFSDVDCVFCRVLSDSDEVLNTFRFFRQCYAILSWLASTCPHFSRPSVHPSIQSQDQSLYCFVPSMKRCFESRSGRKTKRRSGACVIHTPSLQAWVQSS